MSFNRRSFCNKFSRRSMSLQERLEWWERLRGKGMRVYRQRHSEVMKRVREARARGDGRGPNLPNYLTENTDWD